MKYRIVKNIRGCTYLRESFMALANEVFGLSFEQWHKDGFWTNRYIPYCLTDGTNVLSNVSVNIMDIVHSGVSKRYIQLGTVMTAPEYRCKGFSRILMDEVLRDFGGSCDCIYLFANDSVLDFYPKFGFQRTYEYRYSANIRSAPGDFKRLDMSVPENRELLKNAYKQSNPFSVLTFENNYSLLMFYCTSFLKDCVFYSENFKTICIAEKDGDSIIFHDIFCRSGNLLDIMKKIVYASGLRSCRAVLGFTPIVYAGFDCTAVTNDDDALFILSGSENIFSAEKLSFPLLSHA